MLSTTFACLVCFYGILIKLTYSFMSPVLNYIQQRLWILYKYKREREYFKYKYPCKYSKYTACVTFAVIILWLSKAWSFFAMELFMPSLSNGGADMMHVFVSHQNLLVLIKPSCGSKIWPRIHPEDTRNSIPSQTSTPSPTHPPSPSLTLVAKSYFLTVLNYNPHFSFILHMYCLNKYSLMIMGKKTFTSQNNKAINQIWEFKTK